jgi:anaerobic selenocysteine-containing dehydrogenase
LPLSSAAAPEVELHPAAQARGVANGDWVSIETPKGRVRARARLNDSLDPMSLSASTAGGNPAPKLACPVTTPFGPDGANLNLIIGTAVLDPVSGTASHRSYLCEIRRAA